MNEKIFPWDIPDEIRNFGREQLQIDIEPDNEILNEFRNIFNNSKSSTSFNDFCADFEEMTEDKK